MADRVIGLHKFSDYIENRREMEDKKSVLVGSSVGQNERVTPLNPLLNII
jgi:hypothetical protein